MKKEEAKLKAIAILQNQYQKIATKGAVVDKTWIAQTSSYIKEFLGEDSNEYALITSSRFLSSPMIITDRTDFASYDRQNVDTAKKFISNCIETINNRGLYVPKGNFLSKMTNAQVGWCIVIIIAFLGWLYSHVYRLGETIGKQSIESIKSTPSQGISDGNKNKSRNQDTPKVKPADSTIKQ